MVGSSFPVMGSRYRQAATRSWLLGDPLQIALAIQYNGIVLTTPDSRASILVWAARGGHGATTVAGALAIFLTAPLYGHDLSASRWFWNDLPEAGTPMPGVVHDSGVIASPLPAGATNVVVLRGPCSLALLDLAMRPDPIDHVVLIREPWRPLRRQDAEDALGRPISAEIPFSERVGRLMDAGLLPARVDDLEEFADLRRWAQAAVFVNSSINSKIRVTSSSPNRPSGPSGATAVNGES